MMNLFSASSVWHLSLVCAILIFEFDHCSGFDLSIKIKILDSGGRESSLLYDGGSAELSCYMTEGTELSNNETGVLELFVANNSTHGDFTKAATGNNSLVRYRLPINSAALSKAFKCLGGPGESPTIEIRYVLCSQMSVKPRAICPESKVCHVTQMGSTECKGWDQQSCFYGHHYLKYDKQRLQIKPKFHTVCGKLKGLVRMVFTSAICPSPSQPAGYLAVKQGECNYLFNLSVCHGNCTDQIRLDLVGWYFIDLGDPDSYIAYRSVPDFEVVCDAIYGESKTVRPFKVPLLDESLNKSSIEEFSEQFRHLAMPFVADIVCTGKGVIQFQTYLLLFRSDRDLKYEVAKVRCGEFACLIRMTVTAANGLYVCVMKGTKGCLPKKASNVKVLETIAACPVDGSNCTSTCYIGIFASSPRKKYVLIHSKVVSLTVKPLQGEQRATKENVVNGNVAGTPKSTTEECPWKIGFIIALVVAAIIIIAVVAAVSVLGVKLKKAMDRARQRPIGQPGGSMKERLFRRKPKTTLGASKTEFHTVKGSTTLD